MILSKKATSILEAMIVMLVVVSGITGMYAIYNQSVRLSDSTANKIQAIQIAREGIEAMTNIRNTNWLIFKSDFPNCWNVLNYNSSCVGNDGTTTDIADSGSYTISQNSNNRWNLKEIEGLPGDYSDSAYNQGNRVGLDDNGFYTQSGATTEIKPVFTREIQIEYIDTDGLDGITSNDEKMNITSLVQWKDSASTKVHKVELSTVLSNWKERN